MASLLEFFLAYVAIVSSHFQCGILSHPGACDPGPAGTSDPGFAVEVRRGEEDKKEERSG